MGSNQAELYTKRFIHVKVKSPNVSVLNELKQLMNPVQKVAFAGVYGKILELATISVSTEAIAALTKYYDRPLRCFTFWDFQLAPTLEEFEKIVGCPIGDKEPYLFSGHYASLAKLEEVIKIPELELAKIQQNRNGVRGIPSHALVKKAKEVAQKEEWVLFRDILALLIYGIVLFPNVEGLIDSASIDAFLAYRARKASPVVAILADIYLTFDLSQGKGGVKILCCLPALYVWLVSHVCTHSGRPTCPLEDFRMTTGRDKVKWWDHLSNMSGMTIRWFPKWKEGPNVLCQCGKYPNVPLLGARGGINYNPILVIRQLGYPMRGPPAESAIEPFLFRGFDQVNINSITDIRRAWGSVVRKSTELRRREGSDVGAYKRWLESRVQLVKLPRRRQTHNVPIEEPSGENGEVRVLKEELEKEKAANEKLKGIVSEVCKERDRLKDVNMSTIDALEQETRRAQGEEKCRKRYQGALLGNANELKLRRTERDEALKESAALKDKLKICQERKKEKERVLAENATLKRELRGCWEANEGLKEQLETMERNMLAIVDRYEERMIRERQELAAIHGQVLRDEQAEVLALRREVEIREQVIGQLEEESKKWMDRFAIMFINGRKLPLLLDEAEEAADIFPIPYEARKLFKYCRHMIESMADVIKSQ